MDEVFERVAIVGLGLMGTSLGMALRAGEIARAVVGYDAGEGIAVRARERGAVDVACEGVGEAVRGSDLVVLAAPPLALRELFAAIGPLLAGGAVVTDVASTKGMVVGWAEELLPEPGRFVGGHPMAGREASGVEAADGTLYGGCAWCLTPTARTEGEAVRRVEGVVTALGARPLVLDAGVHDAAVAAISHVPLVAATALTLAATNDATWAVAAKLAAGGFRDTTRVASGDPRMARDICRTNAPAILARLDAYIGELAELRNRIAGESVELEARFAEARDRREAWLRAREG
jgi:prephenate dehydrogenase